MVGTHKHKTEGFIFRMSVLCFNCPSSILKYYYKPSETNLIKGLFKAMMYIVTLCT